MNQYQQYFDTFPFQLAVDMSFDRLMHQVDWTIHRSSKESLFESDRPNIWCPVSTSAYDGSKVNPYRLDEAAQFSWLTKDRLEKFGFIESEAGFVKTLMGLGL